MKLIKSSILTFLVLGLCSVGFAYSNCSANCNLYDSSATSIAQSLPVYGTWEGEPGDDPGRVGAGGGDNIAVQCSNMANGQAYALSNVYCSDWPR